MKRRYSLLFFLVFSISIYAYDLTIDTATLSDPLYGTENLELLYYIHQKAMQGGFHIRYPKAKIIYITVTANAKSIPLVDSVNFNGCRFIVLNKFKGYTLFKMSRESRDITIRKELIDKKSFKEIKQFSKGEFQLIIQDKTPWVKQRQGYNYGAIRKDLLFIRDGKCLNNPIAPYNTSQSYPLCSYLPIDGKRKIFENIIFQRDSMSTYPTFLLEVNNEDNVYLKNIKIETPAHSKISSGDFCLSINNSSRVYLDNIRIENTYSSYNQYGYAIALDNIWNCHFKNIYASAQWGIFGNNNISDIYVDDCYLNRFDVHCYGANFTFSNCVFENTLNDRNTYNQLSSFFGNLIFDHCSFINFTPVLFEHSYNAYKRFDLYLNNCYWKVPSSKPYLIQAGFLDNNINSRDELSQKEWPNVYINGLDISCSESTPIEIFHLYKPADYQGTVKYISQIQMKGINFSNRTSSFVLCNDSTISFANHIHIKY
jgi:hypothetical protein